ncbi:hypothetical protein [Flammeovirga kamogawensis]|uniref:Uncharacterized protein n=1 Tax=Flammeovirga kamogawensis TaxID=373891 RepID=A0ABX8H218_9BACT|nr:hypothetical protein [Flammeovirga kamogawensis]MBB6462638.1 hypothetical protein [Flammeovirga kamogawensis]QWG09617.1 hypothetical protein KM029_23730 [Flammeovirga kamogawensis]TRX65132.1 hypothetical protein EO216_21630 [Flammeovirga kamogawensis]
MKKLHIVLLFLGVLISSLSFAQNVKQNKSANWGNRHVKSSSKGGKPDNAVGYLSEGNLAAFSDKDSLFLEDLTPDLEDLGITTSEWESIQNKLRTCWTLTKKAAFKKAIDELNNEIFSNHNCVAVYAEYGGKGGQKAMTVYSKEAWNLLPN